ncbi:MAG: hypothetical protein Q9162_002765 [Coniocarpon cinnabarinum]
MDFSKLMQAQIAQSTGSQAAKDSTESKYQKKADAEAAREAAYKAGQAALENERLQKAERKRRQAEEETARHEERLAKRRKLAEESRRRQQEEDEQTERERRRRIGLPELPRQQDAESSPGTPQVEGEAEIEDELLKAKLRDLEEPTILFGEDHKRRLKRYYRIQKARLKSVARRPDQPVYTTLEPVPPDEVALDGQLAPPSDVEGRSSLCRKMATWFNVVLLEWGRALARREDDQKASFAGRAATNSHAQALEHLKPLFRKFEKLPTDPTVLPDDLLKPMVDIVYKAQQRRYVHANDVYLQLSIGKAAWPIGVTMVGIHERSAREKLSEDKSKAHIMSDEETRKILQSIKRCLSFAQTKWPPEDMDQLMG